MADLFLRMLAAGSGVQATPETDYDQRLQLLTAELRQAPPQKLVADIPGRGSLLQALDPAQHSLSYLFVLLAHFHDSQQATKKSFPDTFQAGSELWSQSMALLKKFDPIQVRYAGHEFKELISIAARSAEIASRPLLAVYPIREAILRLDPQGSTFTSFHSDFLRLCLRARSYLPAVAVLEKDICHFPTIIDMPFLRRSQKPLTDESQSSSLYITASSGLVGKLNYRHYLEYFLFGGMIYLGLKKWNQALHFLSIVISAPTISSVSLIMVEAYKKWTIACLLEHGKLLPLPRTTTSTAKSAYKALAKPYDALAEVFTSGSLSRLQAEISVGQQVWHADNNSGLVLQVPPAFNKFSVCALERTFAALSIPDITAKIDVDNENAERFITSLVITDRLRACLVQPSQRSLPTILRFILPLSSSNVASEAKFEKSLEVQKDRLRSLLHNLQDTDIKIALGRDYVDSMRKAPKRKDTDDGDGMIPAGTLGGELGLDEDMMGDLH
ncbi:hypothetical protein AJ80_03034 [Polytolypa hystricis UAMH7299]|uniref:COP9 signalosome complex subunit 3 N-terminal helical repeats domain-containing protein n=1 Tax=Polytolypa hystricis (strain UAMH7299) TaxID=1447883 RepID=A0A2B7YKL2_POLH7|nr:hypothetical protein AJ80_03034 [Polytolypa hystricis UAMH7299]